MRITCPQNYRYRGWRESIKTLTFESAFLEEITDLEHELKEVRDEIENQYETYTHESVQASGDAVYSELNYLIQALRKT